MQIKITGIGTDLTPALNEYVNEHIGVLGHLMGADNEAAEALVEVGRSTRHHRHGDVMFACVHLRSNGRHFRAEAEAQDARAAIDEVREELEKEILKFKGKREALFRRGARSIKKFLRISSFARFRKSRISDDEQ
jgi:ribosomal subunit interface protein